MIRVRVVGDLDDLAADLEFIARTAKSDMRKVVARNLREGNRLAKANARRTAGAHGKHYHRAFGYEMTGLTEGEYGPDSTMPQGGMSFEGGSRNQPPHHDLAKSLDVIGPKFRRDVAALPDDWFWPER